MARYEFPTRAVMIVGAAKAALYGMELRRVQELRASGVREWNEDGELAEIRRIAQAVYGGVPAETKNREILSMLAYTQQTMRVSHEEWESIVRVGLSEAK